MFDIPDSEDEADDDRLLFIAYERAWEKRSAEGSGDQVLVDEFRAIDAAPEFFDEGACEHELWFGAWGRGVRPSKMQWYAAKQGVSLLADGAREIRSLLSADGEFPEWMRTPSRYARLSEAFSDGTHKRIESNFTPDPDAAAVFQKCLVLEPNRKGFRKIPVWLRPGERADATEVMVGESRVGWTAVDERRLKNLPGGWWRRRPKVPDGTLAIAHSSVNGQIEFGRLKVLLPKKLKS